MTLQDLTLIAFGVVLLPTLRAGYVVAWITRVAVHDARKRRQPFRAFPRLWREAFLEYAKGGVRLL